MYNHGDDGNWSLEKEWKAHKTRVLDVVWHPSGAVIHSVSLDGAVSSWSGDLTRIGLYVICVRKFIVQASTSRHIPTLRMTHPEHVLHHQTTMQTSSLLDINQELYASGILIVDLWRS